MTSLSLSSAELSVTDISVAVTSKASNCRHLCRCHLQSFQLTSLSLSSAKLLIADISVVVISKAFSCRHLCRCHQQNCQLQTSLSFSAWNFSIADEIISVVLIRKAQIRQPFSWSMSMRSLWGSSCDESAPLSLLFIYQSVKHRAQYRQ